jgi:Carboxypeptidase regulatory-like domain
MKTFDFPENYKERSMESAFRGVWTSFLLAFLVLALCIGAFAQGGVGELTGLVTDPTGAVVAGAPVKLTNSATGEVRTTTTTAAGTYRFPALQVVGSYTLEVNPKGFKSVKVQDIVVTVGTIVTRDVQLELGATTEQVTVEAGAQLVQSEDSSLSQNVDRQVWTNMPLETRSQNEFMGLLAGAVPAATAELNTDRGPAVNGARSGSGNFLVEGFDNNDQGLGGGGSLGTGSGGANTTISPDAIEEYRVIEHIPPAEYGKAGGFVTDTVLKSGTNQWHGSLFEYNRIQALAANSWFSNASGTQDHLIRNQFGGSIGGPIIKDKTFFFFTVEAHRLRTNSPLKANTTTSDFINFVQDGGFEQFMESDPGGICEQFLDAACPGVFAQQATLGPVYQHMASVNPLPLCTIGQANCDPNSFTYQSQNIWTGEGLGPTITYPVPLFASITVPQATTLNQMRYTTKFDQKITSKDQLNAAFLYDNADSDTAYAGGDNSLGPSLPNHGRAQNIGVTWTHTFSPTLLNQARVSYVRHTGNFPGDPKVDGFPSALTFWDESELAYGNASNLPQFFTENEFIYRDDVSITHGKHNFKTGAEFRRTRNGSSFDAYKNSLQYISGIEDLVTDATFTNTWENYYLGYPYFGSTTYAAASINPTTGNLPVYYRGYRANEVAAYVQDDWRVSPQLTLNLGVRWEYFGPPHNYQAGLDGNFYQGVPTTPFATSSNNPFMPVNSPFYALIATGTVQQRNHDLWNKDLNNFGPRIGFSWDVTGRQKLVVRGGFGVTYDRMYNNIFENARFNPPYFAIANLGWYAGKSLGQAASTALFQAPFTGTNYFFGQTIAPSLRAMDQNLVTPYYEQYNFGFQYQIGKDMVLESNYVGTFGRKLIALVGANTFDGRTIGNGYSGLKENPSYGTIGFRTNWSGSNYNAWQTTLRKRFSNGLQFNGNYTFSKAMDDVSDTFTTKNAGAHAYPTDSMNAAFDYGPADFNIKHRVVASFVYDLPFAKSNRWLGGWNISGIVSVQTGADFNISNNAVDSNKDGEFNDRAVYIGSGKITNAINHNISPAHGYLPGDVVDPNTQAVSNPAFAMWGGSFASDLPLSSCPVAANLGLWCNSGEMRRNTLVGPAFFNTDIGFAKGFKITESTQLRFEGNFFNIFNHPNFLSPDGNLNDVGTFGQSTSTFTNEQTGGPRITQLAVRFDF